MFGEEKTDLNLAYENLCDFIDKMRKDGREGEAIEDIMSCVAYVLKNKN